MRALVAGLLSWSVLVVAAPRAAGQGIKLSAPPPPPIVGDVGISTFSPDGEWIVYSADQDQDEVHHLYSVPAQGGRAPIQLADLSGPNGRFAVAPDGRSVVLRRDIYDLYAVAIDGSRGPVLLNETDDPGFVYDFQFTPDGRRVVYQIYQDGGHELYVVPIDAGAPPRRLNDPATENGGSGSYGIDSLGQRVVYIAGGELWSVRLRSSPFRARLGGGSPAIKLNGPLPPGGDVGSFRITPDASEVVFFGDCEFNGQFELFIVPIDGSAPPRKLSAPPPSGGRDVQDYELSPDGTRAVYRANHLPANLGPRNLYSVPLDGSRPAVQISSLPLGAQILRYRIDPTSTQLVYLANESQGGPYHLFVAPILGGTAPRKLNGTLVEGGSIRDFRIDPAGERVLYTADQDVLRVVELFSASLQRSSLVKLGGGLLRGVTSFQVSGDRAVAQASGQIVFELYSVLIDGSGEPIPLSGPPFTSIGGYSILPDGGSVLFNADRDELEVRELYSVAIDGSGEPRKVNGPLVTGASVPTDVYSFEFTPDGSHAVYFVNGCDPYDDCDEGPTPDGLFLVPTDGSRGPAPLYPPSVPGIVRLDDLYPFRISPDGRRVVYRAGDEGDDGYDELMELYSAPLDGSLPPVRLNDPVEVENDVNRFEITPDGAQVLFVAAGESYVAPAEGGAPPRELFPFADAGWVTLTPDGKSVVFLAAVGQELYEFYVMPLDGSRPPLELGDPLPPNWFLWEFHLSPDGARLVYLPGPYPRSTTELHSFPLDASSRPIQIGGPLVEGGEFRGMKLCADGTRAVYVADQEVPLVFELYSVPVDGSAGSVELSGPLVPGGDVLVPWLHTGGAGGRAVYLADAETDGVVELYSVPVDGSSEPIGLNGSFPGFADVQALQLARNGTLVVYVADALVDETFELFSVPIDASAAPTRLNSPFVAGGDVQGPYGLWNFQVTPDGESVLYVADAAADDVFELFGVPVDGRDDATRLSAPLVEQGDVYSFETSPDSSRVLYIADQDVDYLFELYVSFLPVRRTVPAPTVSR